MSQSLAQQHDDARKFVSLLSFYGYVFKNLVEETFYFSNTDWASLAQLYKELKVGVVEMGQEQSTPSNTTPASRELPPTKQPSRADGFLREPPKGPAALSRSPSQSGHRSQPDAKAVTKVAAKALSSQPQSTSAPTREEYLAKLRAAKLKVGAKATDPAVNSSTNSATPPIQPQSIAEQPAPSATPPAQPQVVIEQPAPSVPQPASKTDSTSAVNRSDVSDAQPAPANHQDEAETRKRLQTELLQKKLAALRAQRTPAQTPSTAAASAPSQEVSQPQMGNIQLVNAQPLVPVVQASSPTTGIPGLFMAGPPSEAASHVQTAGAYPVQASAGMQTHSLDPVSSHVRSKKRPVAADFDDMLTGSPPRPSKRQTFGDDSYAEDEQMIIEVSDDESDDGVVDVAEGVDDLITSVTQSTNVRDQQASAAKQTALRDLGPLPNFPAQGTFSSGTSTFNTPGGTPASLGQLSKMDADIARLKAKIQASEAAKRRREESRPQTPSRKLEPALANVQPSATGLTTLAVQATPFPRDSSPTQGTLASASSLRSESPAMHRVRRESELQAIDAKLASNISRMENLRREMEALEAENKKRLDEKEALTKELEDLGVIDVEGMDNEAMRAVRDEIRERQGENQLSEEEQPAVSEDITPRRDDEEEDRVFMFDSSAVDGIPVREAGTLDTRDGKAAGDMAKSIDPAVSDFPERTEETPKEAVLDEMDVDPAYESLSRPATATRPFSDIMPDVPPRDNTVLTATMTDVPEMEVGDEDSEDLYSSEPPEQGSPNLPPVSTAEATDELELSDDGEFYSPRPSAVSDGNVVETAGPARTEPAEDVQMSDVERVATPIQEVEHHSSIPDYGQSAAPEEEGNSPLNGSSASSDSGEISESDVGNVYDHPDPEHEPGAGNMDATSGNTSTDQSEAADEEEELEDYEPLEADDAVHMPNPAISTSNEPVTDDESSPELLIADVTDIHVADDLAPELQTRSAPDETSRDTLTATEGYFRPYESSLKHFKSYRYHPQFAENVEGGFRSLTYSHKIDPEKMLCPFEVGNGICNDRGCKFQHYKDMRLTGALKGMTAFLSLRRHCCRFRYLEPQSKLLGTKSHPWSYLIMVAHLL